MIAVRARKIQLQTIPHPRGEPSAHFFIARATRAERVNDVGTDLAAALPQTRPDRRDEVLGATAEVVAHTTHRDFRRPVFTGPESAYWDGWFNVTRTRDESPLRGKVLNGGLVQVLHPESRS